MTTQLGYTNYIGLSGSVGNLPTTPVSIPLAGIWIISYTIRLASSGAVVTRFFTQLGINNVGTTNYAIVESGGSQIVNDAAQSVSNNGTAVINVTNTTTTASILVVANIGSGAVTVSTSSYITLTRIG